MTDSPGARLNPSQRAAVERCLAAADGDLAGEHAGLQLIHGPVTKIVQG
jgi:hypothetical protein